MFWKKYFFPLRKFTFWTYCGFGAYHRIGSIKKDPKYLYWLFDVLPKHACEIKTLQVQVYIKQWVHNELGAVFM